MHFSARKITAATLAALLAALACFEHGLHDVSHSHAGDGCCQSGRLESGPKNRYCSHDHDGQGQPASSESDVPPQHDPDNCAVCRFLALPQLFEAPSAFSSAEMLVRDIVVAFQPLVASRVVTLVPIRGPPTTGLEHSV